MTTANSPIHQINTRYPYIDLAHYFAPFLILFYAVAAEYSGFDIWLSGFFFDREALAWPYKHDWIAEHLVHEWGRSFYFSIVALIMFMLLASVVVTRLASYRKHLHYLLLACIAGPLVVSLLKNMTHIYSPWDLKIFGGSMPYIRVFDSTESQLPIGKAFPAGHASGGYAFICLYFLFLEINPKYRLYGLYAGVTLGLVFGMGQQVRGAHFLSHDMVTLVICWYSALLAHLIIYRSKYSLRAHEYMDFGEHDSTKP